VSQAYRKPILQASLLEAGGQLQHEKDVTHVIAEDLVEGNRWLGGLRSLRETSDDRRCGTSGSVLLPA
jgi:hypothetical protein